MWASFKYLKNTGLYLVYHGIILIIPFSTHTHCPTILKQVSEINTHTDDVLGNMLAGYFSWLAEANLVDSSDAALVLGLVDEVLDDIVGVLQVPGDIAADPVCGVSPLALHQVSNDGASTIVGRSSPGETDGAVGGVCHTGIHNRTRRSWERARSSILGYI